jgi:hypothetical protein
MAIYRGHSDGTLVHNHVFTSIVRQISLLLPAPYRLHLRYIIQFPATVVLPASLVITASVQRSETRSVNAETC